MEILQKNQPHIITKYFTNPNQSPRLHMQLSDIPEIKILKAGSPTAIICTTHEIIPTDIEGVYHISFPSNFFNTVGKILIYFPNDSTPLEREVVEDKAGSRFQEKLDRLLGLSQENIKYTGHTFDEDGNLLSSTFHTYRSKADLEDTDNNDTNYLAQYEMTATYDTNGNLETYKVVKQ